MSRKKIKDVFVNSCSDCGVKVKTRALDNNAAMIKHYELSHSDRMSRCFDLYRRTWNPQYDAALGGLWKRTTELEQLKTEYQKETQIRNSLAAKLNAIILILEDRR